MTDFKDRLKELRTEKGLSLRDLAEEINTTKSTLSRYETGDGQPKQDIVEALADFFEVTTDYLFGRTNQKYFSMDETIAFHADGELSDEDQKMVRNLIDRLVKDHRSNDKDK